MRKSYPSDITKEQFEVIRNVLESAKNVTSPHKYDLYDIFCAVLYLLKEGCRKKVADGEHYHMIFQIGKLCITTIVFGKKKIKMSKAF